MRKQCESTLAPKGGTKKKTFNLPFAMELGHLLVFRALTKKCYFIQALKAFRHLRNMINLNE